MRLDAIRLRNMGPFRDFAIDLANLPGPLVAVTGPNGAGKSTLLELWSPGACYRTTPTRGSLVDLATARDGLLEVQVTNGQRWTLRHLVDNVSKKSEAVVLDAAGGAVLPDTKVRSMDAWAASHLPTPEVLFSCMFAAQGAGGFLAAKPSERKSLLLKLLGIERLETMAKGARERERTAKEALSVVAARIADEEGRGGDLDEAERMHSEALVEEGEARVRLERAQAVLAEAEQQARDVAALVEENRRRESELAKAQEALATRRQEVTDLQARIANNERVLVEGPEIRAAETRAAELAVELPQAEARVAELIAETRALESEIQNLSRGMRETDSAAAAAMVRANTARERLATEALVADALAHLPTLRAALEAAYDESRRLDADLETLRETRLAGAEERISDLRDGLTRIRDHHWDAVDVVLVEELQQRAQWTLESDDDATAKAEEYPERLAEAEAAHAAAQEATLGARRDLDTAERLAAQAPGIEAARADLAAAEREHRALGERREVLAQRFSETHAKQDALRAPLREATETVASLKQEQHALRPLLAKAQPLAAAEGRLAELRAALATAKDAVAQAEKELHGLPAPAPVQQPPSVSAAQAAVRASTEEAQQAVAAVARSEQRLEGARQAAGRLEALGKERSSAEAELADWSRLAQDLGKDGLQALEIDAAGPELTALVNDLLHTCHGPRFTVRVDTQRLASDGKRLLEGCDVVVLDTERGREAAGETYSGGERVIIGEALSLALSMLACRRAGLEGITLVRDETGAALDPANARVYVAMLRRAAEIVQADKVLFVSHSPEVQEMADSRIVVGQQTALDLFEAGAAAE